jgi:predicted transcriptional regulator
MDKKDTKTILHALNTSPKAFFVWGIVDQRPQRPVEMEERLKREFPFLSQFLFLNRNNFTQYCKRSLKGIVIKDYTHWEYNSFEKEVPTWQLVDDSSIQPTAGFLLSKCAEIGLNCDSFLASRKNSSEKHNFDRIQILLDLYKNGTQRLSALGHMSAEWDSTGKCRHVAKLAEAELIEHATFCSRENHIGYQWIEGKNPDEVCYDYPGDRKDKYRIAINRIVRILSTSHRAMSPCELARLAGYASESYTKKAVGELHRQGFVMKLSKGRHSVCTLTDRGKGVVEQIIKPLVLALNGDETQVHSFRETDPTVEHLVTAMEIYSRNLETSCRDP